jgi:kinesin family member 6/9
MMTMVLRDSLGGNCKTKMIATLSPHGDDLYESLSTCRFARNVSMIQNKMQRNERVEPGVIISRLKKEVAELKAELAMAKGGQ